ncbi:MAG: AAA family ATPase [Deltaproteobacteria bacterium]|nr:AAA family ATPase [Deltaproteobacteria bacterium]
MQIDQLNHAQLAKIRIACSRLFPPELISNNEFLKGLDLKTVKRAYWKKAKTCHPDLHPRGSREFKTYLFQRVNHSYEVLNNYLKKELPCPHNTFRGKRKIIAVGGAKGGVGKSIFASNLSVFLSSRGLKTVAIDLDLGGSNLHLYLGEKTILKRNINDFLKKRARTLPEIMTKTKYGPLLIGGDSSEFGSANIQFTQKLKLLKAMQTIEADCVLIDLGGDTSYNILDFFLSADYGIVMTTCESASYVGAYHFIKAALYRKLNRLFGAESKYATMKDNKLARFIMEAITPQNGSGIKTIEELREGIKKNLPLSLPLIDAAISGFNPYLVINKASEGIDTVQVVKKIQEVSRKFISTEVKFLGGISSHRQVGKSAVELVPVVAKYPEGEMSKEISNIVRNLLNDFLA